ncbi:transcriptional regulator [Neorhizobium sp. T786]|nr:transcriptional regulator [Neorhizobium xiangyangii]
MPIPGRLLRAARAMAGYTREQLGSLVNLSETVIRNLENERAQRPDLYRNYKIRAAFEKIGISFYVVDAISLGVWYDDIEMAVLHSFQGKPPQQLRMPGRVVRAGREMIGLTIRQFAPVTGLSIGAIQPLEQGLIDRPNLTTLAILEKAFEDHGLKYLTEDGIPIGIAYENTEIAQKYAPGVDPKKPGTPP